MTELEFFKRIAFREYPGTMAILIVNELVGAALLLIGIGTFVPFLAGLLGGSGAPPGPLADLFEWIGVRTWAPAEVLALLIAMVALRVVLDAVRTYIARLVGIRFERDVKKRMNDAVAGSEWERVLNADHGKYVQCMVSESLQARSGVTNLAAAFGVGFLTLLLLGWLALYSFETFAILVLASVLFLLTNRRLLRLIGEYAKRRIGLKARMNTRVTDTRHVFKVLFAEGLTGAMANAVARFIDAVAVVDRRTALLSVIVDHYVLLYGLAVVAAVSMAHLLHYGTAGSTLLFDLILIQRTASYFGEFQMKRGGLANTIPSYVACLEMMDTHRARNSESRATGVAPALEQGIVVERVSFSFAGRGPVLEDVNFELPAVGLVFFAGPSGSGKTTMVDILLGLLRPKEGGRVLIDGEDLAGLDKTRWRRLVAYVPQDAYILSGTLRDYLSFGLDEVDDQRIWEALERAGAAAFVHALRGGLDTDVQPGGADFSGGERQRLSIARALTRDVRLLILDEPSSALDTETERALFQSLRELSTDMLIVVVTHSTEAIRDTDHMYRFSLGKVIRRSGETSSRQQERYGPGTATSAAASATTREATNSRRRS